MSDRVVVKQSGWRRLVAAWGYSLAGLASAWRHEAAFRQECWLFALLVPLALWLPLSVAERSLLIAAMLAVLVVELLNSAIEAVVDLASPDLHPLAKRAKDMASAAVWLSLFVVVCLWAGLALPLLWLVT